MNIIVTGSCGFIGFHLTNALIGKGHTVIGIDNLNDYYDQKLKHDRKKNLLKLAEYIHYDSDIVLIENLKRIFSSHKPEIVFNMCAQAGVRYSLSNPDEYINTNILGYHNILKLSQANEVKHLIYASSSSVYGNINNLPLKESGITDHPLSVYAATKKTNELLSNAYSNLYGLRCTGIRFFTVYGPWGRPDMSYFKFTKSIFRNTEINIFNQGNHKRDFTYIEDVIIGLIKILEKDYKKDPLHQVFNFGNDVPIKLMDFIQILEEIIGKKSLKKFVSIQKGDVEETHADMTLFDDNFNYTPTTDVQKGLESFVAWYKDYYFKNV